MENRSRQRISIASRREARGDQGEPLMARRTRSVDKKKIESPSKTAIKKKSRAHDKSLVAFHFMCERSRSFERECVAMNDDCAARARVLRQGR